MAYDKTNTGTLGKNKKPQSDRSPEYTGKLNVNGVEFYLNAWVKTNQSTGEKFFSLSVKPTSASARDDERVRDTGDDFKDDIPF